MLRIRKVPHFCSSYLYLLSFYNLLFGGKFVNIDSLFLPRLGGALFRFKSTASRPTGSGPGYYPVHWGSEFHFQSPIGRLFLLQYAVATDIDVLDVLSECAGVLRILLRIGSRQSRG